MAYPILSIVVAILAAGALGGWMNYLMAAKDESRSILKSLVLGIGASFTVPLLLNMISSNLVELIRGDKGNPGDPLKLLVFAGICLVAAIFSTRFIQTIGDRILQELHDTRKLAVETKKEVTPLVTKFTEQPEAPPAFGPKRASLQEPDLKILQALGDPKYAYRWTSGVKKATELTIDEVERRLTDLCKRRLAGKTLRAKDNQVLWYLTSEGQRALALDNPAPEDRER